MKVIVIKFPPEHEDRLRRLCIKKPFILNVAAHKDVEEFAELVRLLSPISWAMFIDLAFPWRSTPEGFEFWKGVANYKTRK